jgi:hypothetical protein
LGYFEVANVNVTRTYTTRAEVPFFIEEVCTYSPTRRLDDCPTTCLRCSELNNSTTKLLLGGLIRERRLGIRDWGKEDKRLEIGRIEIERLATREWEKL